MSAPIILVIDAALGRAQCGILDGDDILAAREAPSGQNTGDRLALMLRDCLAASPAPPGMVAVTTGPGSFTGLRSAIALAAGYAEAAGIELVGVPLIEIFTTMLPGLNRPLWVALTARRGRIFLLHGGIAAGMADTALPKPQGPVAIAGDQANLVASRLAAAGHDVMLTDARQPALAAIAAAARARPAAQGPVLPLYIDPPEAKTPAAGLRPAPI